MRMELQAMRRMEAHPHILPLISTAHDPRLGFLLLVPLAPFGSMVDLSDHLEFEGMAISIAHTAVALLQVAEAALHLDKQSLVHGDIAARNVLVDQYDAARPHALHVMLADFEGATEGKMDPLCLRPLARELNSMSR